MKNRILASASALTATAMLAACSSATDSDDAGARESSTDLTVVLDWTPNTHHNGLYLALERGWYEEAGLDVTVIEPGETSGLDLLAAGQADVAYSVAEGLLPARAAGADVVSVAAVVEHNTSSLVSLTEDGIERPRDLEGKRYGSYGSQLETAIIDALVACDGGDPDLVEHTPLVSDDFRIGLTEDQFDAAWVFDAWDTIRLRDVDGLDVSTLAFRDWFDCIPDWYTPLLATSAELIEQSPDTVRAFVETTARGYAAAMEEPQEAADALLAAAPELDEELVRLSSDWLATRYSDSPQAWGAQDVQVWDEFADWLSDGDILEGDPDVAHAWTDEFLPESP